MLNTIKTAALSAVIGLGTLAAIPASAQAEGLYLNLGQGDPAVGIYVQNRDGGRWESNDDRRGGARPDDRWGRPHDNRWDRACSPDRALDKAERMGVRRARVVDVDRRTISVVGRKYGERIRLTFARAPNCPIVRW